MVEREREGGTVPGELVETFGLSSVTITRDRLINHRSKLSLVALVYCQMSTEYCHDNMPIVHLSKTHKVRLHLRMNVSLLRIRDSKLQTPSCILISIITDSIPSICNKNSEFCRSVRKN